MRTARGVVVLLCALMLAQPAATQQQVEPLDLDAVYKIKEQGLQQSQVMEIMSWLTDIHGPRLTGSPNIRAAADWAVKKLTEWGVSNPRLEPWGPFGRGWSSERFYAHVISPQPFSLIAYPRAWTPGTDGWVTGEAILAVLDREEDFEKFRGKLRGKIVLPAPMREVNPLWEPPARRHTDEGLARLAEQPIPGARPPQIGPPGGPAGGQQQMRRRMQFYVEEGVLAVFEPARGDGGTVFVTGVPRDPSGPPVPPLIAVAIEHYGRIVRTLEKNLPVTIELNIQNKFHEEDRNSFNVIGEIPGTDKADELVMLGAHFDSWHAGTGATDNAAGSAVMLEAMRILKASGLKMRRTVRLALWTGEEQGLLGSRAYVTQHFADRTTMQLKPAHAKFSGYFNIDNGTGRIRGVYLQGHEAIGPVFARWMEPFRNMGMTTLAIRNTGGTDHLAFDAVGLPGFQFIQDPMEYSTRTHHSNMDVYERIQAEDMKQIATIVAAFVYHAANREQLLPRKPLPPPQRQPQRGGSAEP